jgi:phage baseplate assembly protein W
MSRGPQHLGYPLRLDGRGRTAPATEGDYLRGLVETVLFTRPGERVNRPDFGSGVNALVFAPSGDELAQATQALVHGSLQRWLGDLLQVDEVTVEAVESTLTVTISYVPLSAAAGAAPRLLTVTGPAGAGP